MENPKDLKTVLDVSRLTDEQKDLLEDLLEKLQASKDLKVSEVLDQLKINYILDEIPKRDYKKSLWYQFTKDDTLSQCVQGHQVKYDKDGKKIKVPFFAFAKSLDDLDEIINRIIKSVKEMKF